MLQRDADSARVRQLGFVMLHRHQRSTVSHPQLLMSTLQALMGWHAFEGESVTGRLMQNQEATSYYLTLANEHAPFLTPCCINPDFHFPIVPKQDAKKLRAHPSCSAWDDGNAHLQGKRDLATLRSLRAATELRVHRADAFTCRLISLKATSMGVQIF